jgi:hypothetical protein
MIHNSSRGVVYFAEKVEFGQGRFWDSSLSERKETIASVTATFDHFLKEADRIIGSSPREKK